MNAVQSVVISSAGLDRCRCYRHFGAREPFSRRERNKKEPVIAPLGRAWELADPISTPGFLFGWRLEKLLLRRTRGLRILVPVIPSAAKPTGCRLSSSAVPDFDRLRPNLSAEWTRHFNVT